jgi:hypothetical protein
MIRASVIQAARKISLKAAVAANVVVVICAIALDLDPESLAYDGSNGSHRRFL